MISICNICRTQILTFRETLELESCKHKFHRQCLLSHSIKNGTPLRRLHCSKCKRGANKEETELPVTNEVEIMIYAQELTDAMISLSEAPTKENCSNAYMAIDTIRALIEREDAFSDMEKAGCELWFKKEDLRMYLDLYDNEVNQLYQHKKQGSMYISLNNELVLNLYKLQELVRA